MRLVYLLRDEEKARIDLVFKKPVGVRVSQNVTTWYFRTFDFQVGEIDTRLLFTDGWTGPIGVFDLDKPKHLRNLFEMSQAHLRAVLERKVLQSVAFHEPVVTPGFKGGDTSRTPIASDIIRIFRHGDEWGSWEQ